MIYIFIFAWICRPASIFFHTFLVLLIFVDLLVAFELRQMHMYYIESICSNDSFLFFFFFKRHDSHNMNWRTKSKNRTNPWNIDSWSMVFLFYNILIEWMGTKILLSRRTNIYAFRSYLTFKHHSHAFWKSIN